MGKTTPLRWIYFLIAIQLIPLWSFRYFPSQDGPAHIENAKLLLQLICNNDATASKFYVLNHWPIPNLIGHVVMAALMGVHLPPGIAEKLLVSLYVLGFPLSVMYAARSICRDNGWVAVLSLPFTYSLALHKGLYNYCLSLPLMFLVIGYWMRHCDTLTWRRISVLTLLFIVTYFAHVVSLVMAMMTIGLLALGFSLITYRSQSQLEPRRRAMICIGMTTIAMLPAALLLAAFFLKPSAEVFEPDTAAKLIPQLLKLDALVSYHPQESVLGVCVALLLGGSLFYVLILKAKYRDVSRWDLLLIVAAAMIVIYFRTPNRAAGGGQIGFRLSLYPFLILPLWLAAQRRSFINGPRRLTLITVPTIAMTFLSLYMIDYRELGEYLAEFNAAAGQLNYGDAVISINVSDYDYDKNGRIIAERVRPFRHAIGYMSADRGVLDLQNYEGELDYFPVQYRNGFSPSSYFSGEPNALESLEREANHSLDYVLVWQTKQNSDSTQPAALLRQVYNGYDLAFTSSHGWAKLYHRRSDSRIAKPATQ